MKVAGACVCCGGVELERNAAILSPFVAYRIFRWEPAEISSSWGLRDIDEGKAYSVCNTLRCAECGLVFLDMRFDDEELEALYNGYRDAAYTSARERFEPGYAARNAAFLGGSLYIPVVEAFLSPYLPAHARVLDWGGDTGVNTPFRETAALRHVYDISNKLMVPGATRVDRERLLTETYDLIVLSQVLEHIPYPRTMLAEIVRVMKPQSYLYIEVPYEQFMRLRETHAVDFKRHWHEHINFFTHESLSRLLQSQGLEIVATAENEVSVVAGRDAVVISILTRLGNVR